MGSPEKFKKHDTMNNSLKAGLELTFQCGGGQWRGVLRFFRFLSFLFSLCFAIIAIWLPLRMSETRIVLTSN